MPRGANKLKLIQTLQQDDRKNLTTDYNQFSMANLTEELQRRGLKPLLVSILSDDDSKRGTDVTSSENAVKTRDEEYYQAIKHHVDKLPDSVTGRKA
jgi:hypothetical protein